MSENVSEYLSWQNYNAITKYLHSIRYHHLNCFLNNLPKQQSNIFEIGCGYGKSLDLLTRQNKVGSYLGIDIEQQFIEYCQAKYGNAENSIQQDSSALKSPHYHQFLNADIRDYVAGNKQLLHRTDAVIALECFEHINEYDMPNIIHWLSSLRCPLFVTIPNEIGPAILLKNVGSYLLGYIRHQEYHWSETLQATLGNIEAIRPHGTGHRGFDWRWLRAVLHQKFIIQKIGTSPWNFVPKFLSPSLYFYCLPR